MTGEDIEITNLGYTGDVPDTPIRCVVCCCIMDPWGGATFEDVVHFLGGPLSSSGIPSGLCNSCAKVLVNKLREHPAFK